MHIVIVFYILHPDWKENHAKSIQAIKDRLAYALHTFFCSSKPSSQRLLALELRTQAQICCLLLNRYLIKCFSGCARSEKRAATQVSWGDRCDAFLVTDSSEGATYQGLSLAVQTQPSFRLSSPGLLVISKSQQTAIQNSTLRSTGKYFPELSLLLLLHATLQVNLVPLETTYQKRLIKYCLRFF